MSQTERLIRRKGIWHYRRRVPNDLVEVVGRREIHQSLGTFNLRDARKLRTQMDLVWDSRFQTTAGTQDAKSSASQPKVGPLSTPEMLRLMQEYVAITSACDANDALANPPSDEEERRTMQESIETAEMILTNRDDPRALEWVHGTLAQLTAKSPPPSTDVALGEVVRRGLIELERRKLKLLENLFDSTAGDPLFAHGQPSEMTFGILAKQFLEFTAEEAEANRTNRKWVDKQRAHVALLAEMVGELTPLRQIDYDACMRVRSLLGRIPANRSKRYEGLSIEEAIKAAEADRTSEGLSAATQKAYLATFQGIMDLAQRKGLITINPAQGLKPLKKESLVASARRVPFTDVQLKSFFEGEFYRKCGQQHPAWASDTSGWRFWLPLLCLFMGMRPNEVCQMGVDDVRQTERGTWYLDIVATEDDDENNAVLRKSLKTATSRRRIPIHPEVLAIGFMNFVSARRDAGCARLFPELKPDRYGNCAKYAMRRFRETFLPNEIVLEARQSFYSFRHNFRDALRAIEAPPDALQALGAWSQGKLTSDDYGNKHHPDYQARYMEKVAYPDVDLSQLHV